MAKTTRKKAGTRKRTTRKKPEKPPQKPPDEPEAAERPAGELVAFDGGQARLPGQEKVRLTQVEKAAIAHELARRKAKLAAQELELATQTLLFELDEAKIKGIYDVEGVKVEIGTSRRVAVDVPDERLPASAPPNPDRRRRR